MIVDIGIIVSLEGRIYFIDILYFELFVENYVECVVDIVFDIYMKEFEGDILVFFMGCEEIDNVVEVVFEWVVDFG